MLMAAECPTCGSDRFTSNTLVLTMVTIGPSPPSVSSQPLTQSVMVGQKATFSVTASGTGPLAYQWQHAGVDVPSGTNTSLTLTAVTTNNMALAIGNKIVNTSSNKLVLTIMPQSGLFKGTITPPSGPVSKPFSGVLLRRQGCGGGFFLGTNQSGNLYFGP